MSNGCFAFFWDFGTEICTLLFFFVLALQTCFFAVEVFFFFHCAVELSFLRAPDSSDTCRARAPPPPFSNETSQERFRQCEHVCHNYTFLFFFFVLISVTIGEHENVSCTSKRHERRSMSARRSLLNECDNTVSLNALNVDALARTHFCTSDWLVRSTIFHYFYYLARQLKKCFYFSNYRI